MRIETDLPSFLAWFPTALMYWAFAIVTLVVAAKLFGFLIAAVEYGPVEGARRTKRTISSGLADLVRMSPRRVGALAWLAEHQGSSGGWRFRYLPAPHSGQSIHDHRCLRRPRPVTNRGRAIGA